MRKVIHWFRNDLRVHDNEALTDALQLADEVIPVFIFDDRIFKAKTKFGFAKTGKYRCQFIIESVENLRQNLEKIGLRLIVRSGLSEDILFDIASQFKTRWIFCNRERTQEEVQIQDALEEKLWAIGQEIKYYRGKMLYYTSDLPFPMTHCPDIFTSFRKEVEKYVPIREPYPVPASRNQQYYSNIEEGPIPQLDAFGFSPFEVDKGYAWKGGEDAALAELEYYVWEKNLASNYFKTRNGLLGRDFSSKFSAYLSQGCISPKKIYQEIKKYEEERGANKSTYWLIFELMWRDFFRFMAKKHKNKIFQLGGTKSILDDVPVGQDQALIKAWCDGNTGVPFIDANMRELNQTGFMSNRGRQNVASYLVHDLKQNWLVGAEYFESLLVDYDPCSNYGNWNYVAGVGSDPRENRKFNIPFQASKYDADGEFVKYWIQSLHEIPKKYIHQLTDAPEEIRALANDYLSSCISLEED